MRFVLLGACALALGSCAAKPQVEMVNIRTDGQEIRGNPALQAQFEIDKSICEGEMSKANMGGAQFCRGIVDCAVQGQQRSDGMQVVGKGCMAERGYVRVPEDEREARMAAFRANQPRPVANASVVKQKK